MSRVAEMMWVGFVALAFTSSASLVGAVEVETATPVEAVEGSEEDEATPLNLRACAALLALKPGQWVIVDGKELQRVPGWAEEVEVEDDSFTGLPECARRIGLPAQQTGNLQSMLEDEVGGFAFAAVPAAPAEAARKPIARRRDVEREPEIPAHWIQEDQPGRLLDFGLSSSPVPVPAPPVTEPAESPEPQPEADFEPMEMPRTWQLFAGMSFSLGESEPASLVPVLASPEPPDIPFEDHGFDPSSFAQILDLSYLTRPIPKISIAAALPLAPAPKKDAPAQIFVSRSRSSDGAVEVQAATPLPEPGTLALVGASLLALAAFRARRPR